MNQEIFNTCNILQEWRLHEHIEVSKKVMTQEYSSSNRCHPALSVMCQKQQIPMAATGKIFEIRETKMIN